MFRSLRPTLLAAFAFALAAAAVWIVALRTVAGARLDATIATGFLGLQGPRIDGLARAVAHLADPAPFTVATTAIVAVALIRRRPWLAGMAFVTLGATGVTTQVLKALTAEPRLANSMIDGHVAAASWPSGHATAAMAIALCAVVVAPARWRPLALAAGSTFAIGVGYSVIVLSWHLPSDVIGAFCVAAAWTLLGIAAVTALERRLAPGQRLRLEAALAPAAAAGLAVGAGIAAAALTRPDAALAYAETNTTFVVAAAAIGSAVLALVATIAATAD
jgi:membrane-associated phospholipid phosphatase